MYPIHQTLPQEFCQRTGMPGAGCGQGMPGLGELGGLSPSAAAAAAPAASCR